MGLTAAELEITAIVTKVFSCVGFLGVCLMAWMYVKSPKSFSNVTGRLIIAITFTDLMDSSTKFIGRWGPEAGYGNPLCMFQAWSITQFNLASVILGLLMGVNALYIIYFKGSLETIQKNELKMIAVAFLLPIPLSVAPLFLFANGKPLYGDVNLWCWVNQSEYQIFFWFGILWVIFILNIVLLFFTLKGIRMADKSLLTGKLTKQQKIEQKKKSFGTFVTKRMVAYIVAFFISWTASSVNRVTRLISGDTYFFFSLAQAIFSPSRGMINFGAYFYTWWHNPAHDRSISENKSSKSISKGNSGMLLDGKMPLSQSGKMVTSPSGNFNFNRSGSTILGAKTRRVSEDDSKQSNGSEFFEDFDYDVKEIAMKVPTTIKDNRMSVVKEDISRKNTAQKEVQLQEDQPEIIEEQNAEQMAEAKRIGTEGRKVGMLNGKAVEAFAPDEVDLLDSK